MNKFTIKKKIIESNLIIVFLKFFPFLILIISTLSFYLIKSDFTAFQQNTHTFIPGLEFQNSKEIDFYTSSILESPKINLINFINFFFSDWYFGIYFFKVFLTLSIYPSIWFLYLAIINHKLKYENIYINHKIYFIIFLFFVFFLLGFFNIFQGAGSSHGPLGYGSIQFMSDFNSMNLSFILGIYGIVFALNKNNLLNIISIITIFISTIIHPAMGLNNVIILFLFFSNKLNFIYVKKILTYSVFSLIIPIIILKFYFPADKLLSGKEFFDIYVNFRHPHHYLISDKILRIPFSIDQFDQIKVNIHQLYFFTIWSTLFLTILIFSYKYTKKIFLLNFLIFIIFHSVPVIQYFFAEIFHIKVFIELGITRFTSLLTIILLIQVVLNIIYFLNYNTQIIKSKSVTQKRYFNLSIFKNLFVFLIISLIVTKATYVHPLDDKKFIKYHSITSWVKINIDNKEEFIIENQKDVDLINFLRVFGKQKIFYDEEGFPFSPKYILEYKNRKIYHEKIIKYFKEKKPFEINNNYNNLIGYLLIEKNNSALNIEKLDTIYEDDIFIIKKTRF